jgi:pimeloyl-ACP methyl ester carboxylesterase
VLAPDLPGFGRSPAAGKQSAAYRPSIKNYADTVLRLIRAVLRPSSGEGEKAAPVYIAGNSLGAIIAEEAAFKAPDLVCGLVLIGGSIPGGPKRPGPIALMKLLFSRKWYRAYRKNPENLWNSLQPYYADLDGLPVADKDFLRQRVMARVESPAQEKAFFAAQRSAIRAYLTASACYAWKIRRYKGKIALIWGEEDRIIPSSSAKVFTSLRADIDLKVIPGAGHLPQQEKPEELANLMEDFEKST